MLLLAASCKTPYKGIELSTPQQSVYSFKPQFDKVLYRGIVDGKIIFKKFHLSGVLFFKQLENGTKRAIFQNEMGVAFFDFEWDKDGNFRKRQVIPQMDKEAVIRTLRKDMEMLLMEGMDLGTEKQAILSGGKQSLHRLNRGDGFVYYTTTGEKIIKIENTNNRKRIVSVDMAGATTNTTLADSIMFYHHKANFTISLKKIVRNVDE